MIGRLPDSDVCPYLRGPCIQARCRMWRHFIGQHPQTGAPMDVQDCSIAMQPVLQIETSKEIRRVQESAERARALGEQVARSQALGRATPELEQLLQLPATAV